MSHIIRGLFGESEEVLGKKGRTENQIGFKMLHANIRFELLYNNYNNRNNYELRNTSSSKFEWMFSLLWAISHFSLLLWFFPSLSLMAKSWPWSSFVFLVNLLFWRINTTSKKRKHQCGVYHKTLLYSIYSPKNEWEFHGMGFISTPRLEMWSL